MRYLYLVLLWLLVAYSEAGHSAEVYKWVDEDGKVYFSDSPPSDVITEKIEPPPAPSKDDIRRAQVAADLLIEQQRVSADQRAQEREEKRLQKAEAEQQAVDRAILCSRARRSLYALLQPRAAFTINERGERVYIPDTFRQAEIEEQKRVVAANCE